MRFASIVICVALARPARAGTDQATLPLDPSVTRGALANGVGYWLAPQPSAAGVAIWMRVEAGSLQEEKEESGLAHFVEHLAFRGTLHYPDGAVVQRFEALGLTIGVDENAITTPRGTIYKVTLPSGDAWREGLRMMADFAYRRETTTRAVDDERRVVLAEMRAADSRASRLERRITAATFASSQAASRAPLGRPDVIERAGVADVERFLARWYRPERTTVLVAGQIDAAAVAAAITLEFNGFRSTPEEVGPNEPRPTPLDAPRTVVITDPEQTAAEIRFVYPEPLRPVTTVDDLRARLVERLALETLNQRLGDLVDGGGPFFDAYTDIESAVYSPAPVDVVLARGPVDSWRRILEVLTEVIADTRDERSLGVAFATARRVLLSHLRRAVVAEPTLSARARVSEMHEALATRETPMSARDRLTASEALLNELLPAEVARALRARFLSSAHLLVLALPDRMGGHAPDDAELARVVAQAARQAAPTVASRPVGALLRDDPIPRPIQGEANDGDGVRSLTLGNGVRAHVRSTADRAGQVWVQVTLGGGELLETPSTRGLSEAATLAFDSPATETLSPASIRPFLAGRAIELSGCACEPDALTASLVTGAADLEDGLRLLHLVLTRGKIARPVLQAWKDRALEWTRHAEIDPESRTDDEMAVALADGDPRIRPPTLAQLARIDLAAAQAWLDRHLVHAPVEVAIVGDRSLAELERLANTYFGALPPRPFADDRLRRARQIEARRPTPPGAIFVDSQAPRSALAVAWRVPDPLSGSHRAALEVAARILSERLREDLRVRQGVTYGVSCALVRSPAVRGASALEVTLSAEHGRTPAAARTVEQELRTLRTQGPRPAELEGARKQLQARRAADLRDPSVWVDDLSTRDYHLGQNEDPALRAKALEAVTAETVRATLTGDVIASRALTLVTTPRSQLVLRGRELARPTDARPGRY